MIGLIQRVSTASVEVENKVIGSIDQGILLLVGVEREDNEKKADRLLERILTYRIFADQNDKMNLSLQDISGGLLLVPQFTLAADTKKGTRPGFSTAATPDRAKQLFEYCVNKANEFYSPVATGKFGADMKVCLINDGPVTFWIQV